MKILLIGEYSNVHATLARGLRKLGHTVTVASGGDSWKNYPRDIDLRHSLTTAGHLSFLWRLLRALPRLRGYDVVQIINPVFLEMRAWPHRWLLDYLRRHNGKLVLGAFGMDYYWAQVNRDIRPMRYSDFNIGDTVRTDAVAQADADTWIGTPAEHLCRYATANADAIVAGLYEYWITYRLAEGGALADKTTYIPLPIESNERLMILGRAKRPLCVRADNGQLMENKPYAEQRGDELREDNSQFSILNSQLPISVFVGISKGRSQYKGTDIMLRAAQRLQQAYPDRIQLLVAEGVPFAQYQRMMEGSDVILDQLYGYTPAMNALLAMSKGIICVGGGEPEHYDLLGETELRPIINVEPNEESVYSALEDLVLHPERVPELKRQSIEYVRRHHDVHKVALAYEALYRRL